MYYHYFIMLLMFLWDGMIFKMCFYQQKRKWFPDDCGFLSTPNRSTDHDGIKSLQTVWAGLHLNALLRTDKWLLYVTVTFRSQRNKLIPVRNLRLAASSMRREIRQMIYFIKWDHRLIMFTLDPSIVAWFNTEAVNVWLWPWFCHVNILHAKVTYCWHIFSVTLLFLSRCVCVYRVRGKTFPTMRK